MEPFQLIKHDHQNVERLFKRMERTLADGGRREIAEALHDLTRELSIHAAMEEQFLYPSLRRATAHGEAVLDAIEEHHVVKLTLSELQATPPEDERFRSKVRLLISNVRAHVEEEERELLPALERALEPEQQRELGAALTNAKLLSPTRPHPSAPETPPGNLILGPVVGVLDRVRDTVREGMFGVRRFTESALEATVILLRRLSSDAERRGRDAVGDLAARTRVAADEAREAGRRTIEHAAVRGIEAARQLRAPARATGRARKRRRAARDRA